MARHGDSHVGGGGLASLVGGGRVQSLGGRPREAGEQISPVLWLILAVRLSYSVVVFNWWSCAAAILYCSCLESTNKRFQGANLKFRQALGRRNFA